MVSDSRGKLLSVVLKVIAPVFLLVSVLHLALGLNADVLLGANIPQEAISDPVLDSQNRFYGVAFAVFGVVLFLHGSEILLSPALLLWLRQVLGRE